MGRESRAGYENLGNNPFVRVVTAKKKTTKKRAAKPSQKNDSVGTATLASILGTQPPAKEKNGVRIPSEIKSQWVKYYRVLLELRDRLVEQRAGLAKESAETMDGYSLHMADCGTDNFDRDFALSLLSSDQDAIYEIEEALKRIQKNTFGICELTGKTIPRARLDAIPWTRFTVEAQTQLERDGALRQRRLGALGSIDSTAGSDYEEDEDSEDRAPKNREG